MTDVTTIEQRLAKIEKASDLSKSAAVQIGVTVGGIHFATPVDIDIMAQRLARAGAAVPPHCRDNVGMCFGLITHAIEWGFPIMAVLNKSYVVNNKGVDRVAFESQLIHAIVERNAPLKNRLRFEILGVGDERRCKVWGTFKRETKPHEYTSETLKKLLENRPARKDGSGKGGSPLWEQQPEVQMFYSASRTWARIYCPEVILGAYTRDELEDPDGTMVDVTPVQDRIAELSQRLEEAQKQHVEPRGFDPSFVKQTVEGELVESDVTVDPFDTPETVADKAQQAAKVMKQAAATLNVETDKNISDKDIPPNKRRK